MNDYTPLVNAAFDIATHKRGELIPIRDTVTLDGREYSRLMSIAVVRDTHLDDSHPHGVYVCGETSTHWFITRAQAVAYAVKCLEGATN